MDKTLIFWLLLASVFFLALYLFIGDAVSLPRMPEIKP